MADKITLNQKKEQVKLYIGIDVHLKSWHVTICSKTMILQSFSQPPTVEALKKYLETHYPDAIYYSVYESGFCGFWVHRKLLSDGIENIVVNASDVPSTDKEKRQKRDQFDSMKLAKSLRSGLLKCIYIPSIEEQEDRSLIRVRKQLVRDIARFKNRIKSHLYYKGIEIPPEFLKSGGYWNNSFKVWLSERSLSTYSGSRALNQQLESLLELEAQLKKVNQCIKELAETDQYKDNMELITSIPGIGVLSGMIILAELGDINRFQRTDHLHSYAGFIPNVYASGEKEYVGSLTKRGNSYLRTTIIECSWWAVKKDPALSMAYEKLRLRMRPSKAIIRIGRKLLSRIRHIIVNNEKYQLGIAA